MPSIVPEPTHESDLHFVLCDFGVCGRAYIETDPEAADRGAVVRNIITGQYRRPLKVIALHPDGRWRDVSRGIAQDVTAAAARSGESLPDDTRQFLAEMAVAAGAI